VREAFISEVSGSAAEGPQPNPERSRRILSLAFYSLKGMQTVQTGDGMFPKKSGGQATARLKKQGEGDTNEKQT
jgi:hypothetical protein